MNRDNTPTYNSNRKVVNFGDYCNNYEKEKEELKKMKRQTTPNSDERQKNPGNSKYKFNRITRKMDDLSPDMVEDQIEKMEEVDESKVNESHIDDKIYHLVSETECYGEFQRKVREAKQVFVSCIKDEVPEFDEGDNDHDMAVNALISEAGSDYY